METVTINEALGDETVTLNVGGVIFKTYYRTLARLPDTRLFDLAYQHAVNPDIQTADIFFDNDPTVFSSVLDYYRNGQLYTHRVYPPPTTMAPFLPSLVFPFFPVPLPRPSPSPLLIP